MRRTTRQPPARTELSSLKPEQNKGFGMTIDNVTSDLTRRMRLPENQRGAIITTSNPAARPPRPCLHEGDIIFKVGRTPVASSSRSTT